MPSRDENKLARWSQPALRLATLNLLVSLALLGTANSAFWGTVLESRLAPGAIAAVAVLALIIVNLLLTAATWGRLAKPALQLLLLACALVTWFMTRYGVVFDRDMIANVVETDLREAGELLLNGGLIAWMLVFGVLPCLALQRVRLVRGGCKARSVEFVTVLLASALALGAIAATSYQPLAALVRNHRELRFQLVPLNFIAATYRYASRVLHQPGALQPVGVDARRAMPAGPTGRRRVTFLVVGETARAANFSLLGYARDTNPEMSRHDPIVLRDVQACGTATATSVPCMFQDVGRTGYRASMAKERENLLDVLQRAGIEVLWRENNGGCKHVCDRVEHEDLAHVRDAQLCPDGQCRDEILLRGLQGRLDRVTGDALIVLHMLGSHGPAYHKRYPARFEVFGPACTTGELQRCSVEEIVNAYDNTIRYTDHVLSELVALLQRNASAIDATLLYVSDHGESLGEHGLFLHGLPYAIAPAEQTHVPMLVWLSSGMRRHVDMDCLRKQSGRAYSHDNLFHSVLGLMHVQTAVYRRERDLFSSCMRTVG